MWMSLLSVLNTTPDDNLDQEEINNITHTMSLAVRAITSLLIQTLYIPIAGNRNLCKLLHVPRDRYIETSSSRLYYDLFILNLIIIFFSISKLKKIQINFECEIKTYYNNSFSGQILTNVFDKCNIEKLNNSYTYGQLSLEYLLVTSNINNTDSVYVNNLINSRNKMLKESGLDINSCIQFFLDLYSQWISQQVLI